MYVPKVIGSQGVSQFQRQGQCGDSVQYSEIMVPLA